ncbi:MAG: C39 family peptidase [Candidatus Uhrbacteria bacterium]
MRSWRFQIGLGVIFASAAIFVWVRQEAHIAETPANSILVDEQQTKQDAVTAEEKNTFSPSISEGERPVPTEASGGGVVGVRREGEITRNDEGAAQQFIVHRSSFIVLGVPFVSQAPFRVWDLPYKEFCEEAAVYTLYLWKEGKPTPLADELDRALKDIQTWETANIRTWEDTTADETVRILQEKFGYTDTRVVRNVTIAQMKAEIDAGRPIIVPAAGRELSSPYYRPPGPLYHMLVVIGYDDRTNEFITNDVGTNTKGAGFRFTYDDLYGAMHDWVVDQGPVGERVMIVVE